MLVAPLAALLLSREAVAQSPLEQADPRSLTGVRERRQRRPATTCAWCADDWSKPLAAYSQDGSIKLAKGLCDSLA